MQYYVRIRGKAFGPFDENQLLEMKTKGKLGRTSEVSENGIDWKSAGILECLYPNPNVQTKPEQPPPEPSDWFYSVNGTEVVGPVTVSAIGQMMQDGQLYGKSFVWKQEQKASRLKT